jgi:biopolymer transport protein ExbD
MRKRRLLLNDEEPITKINIVPMVDIFLVLLVIFILTAKFFVEEAHKLGAIPVELPKAATGKKQSDIKKMSIVIYRNGDMTLNGKKAGFKDLKADIEESLRNKLEFQAVISADKQTPYQNVVTVMDFLQLNGVEKFAMNVEIVDLEKK